MIRIASWNIVHFLSVLTTAQIKTISKLSFISKSVQVTNLASNSKYFKVVTSLEITRHFLKILPPKNEGPDDTMLWFDWYTIGSTELDWITRKSRSNWASRSELFCIFLVCSLVELETENETANLKLDCEFLSLNRERTTLCHFHELVCHGHVPEV